MEEKKREKLSLRMLSKQQWAVVILLGLLLVVIAMPTSERLSEDTSQNLTQTGMFQEGQETEENSPLEKQLAGMLGQIEGVGQVQVMVYKKANSSLTSMDNDTGEIQGVLIVAEGGDNSVTVRKIQEVVMALFQVEAHKIKVMKMK